MCCTPSIYIKTSRTPQINYTMDYKQIKNISAGLCSEEGYVSI